MLKVSLHPPEEDHHISKYFEGDLCPAINFYSQILLLSPLAKPLAVSPPAAVISIPPHHVPRMDTQVSPHSPKHQ